MIFWDQYSNKIDEDEQDAKSEEGSAGDPGGSGDNQEKKPKEVKKPEQKPAPKPAAVQPSPAVKPTVAAKSSEPIDVEFEGFEEKSETKLDDIKKPSIPQKAANNQNTASSIKPAGRFKSLFNKGAINSDAKSTPKLGGGGGSGGGSDDGDNDKGKAGIPNWSEDLFESVITQRNILFLFTIVCVVTIAMSVLLIRYVKTAQTIEPFVIEIEEKSGIPTVVTPVSTRVYSEDDAIKRYFIMKYIRAREEYFPSTFQENFFNVARVLSTSSIYYNDYRPKFSISNPNSPYNIYGESSSRRVVLKSLIFQSAKTAQVRIAFEVNGIVTLTQNKIILIDFDFANIEMNDEERFINPLGFQVTFYRIEDESN